MEQDRRAHLLKENYGCSFLFAFLLSCESRCRHWHYSRAFQFLQRTLTYW